MKIALISPKGPLYRYRSGIFRKSLRTAPLTLTTLAALIPPELEVELRLYDEGIEDLPENLEADLIGMTVITGTAPRAYALSEKFRKQGKTVVLGGPHITLVPEDAAPHADSIVSGYAEETWPQLLRDFAAGQLKSRYDMDRNFSFARLTEIPFPKRELLDRKGFKSMNTFEATRGCVHPCDFCVVPAAWGRRPFQKPIDHVIADIRQYGAKQLVFFDLNIIADRRYAKELFSALIPLNVKWFGLSTTLIGDDEELMHLMARSGCKGLLIGFESVSSDALGDANKKFNRPDKYAELVKKLHAMGIALNGTFVFGNDSDDLDSFKAVEDFVLSNAIDLPRFAVLTPFPGTPLYSRLEQEGRILTRDWSLYDGQHVVFKPQRMSPQQLLNGHERIWESVYSYRGIGRRTFSHIRERLMLLPLILAANIGYRYYARNLSQFYTCLGGTL